MAKAKRVITPAQRKKMLAGLKRVVAARKKRKVTEIPMSAMPVMLGAFPKGRPGKGKRKKLDDVTRERDMLRALVLFYISKED